MLSSGLIAILAVLLGFVVYVMVATQLERRRLRVADRSARVGETRELAEQRSEIKR